MRIKEVIKEKGLTVGMVGVWGFVGDREKGLDKKMIKKGIINPSNSDHHSIQLLDTYLIQKFSIRE